MAEEFTHNDLLKKANLVFAAAAGALFEILPPDQGKELIEKILPDIRFLFPVRAGDQEMKRLMLAYGEMGDAEFASDEEVEGKILIPVINPTEFGAHLYLMGLLDGSIPRDPISSEPGFPEIPTPEPMENQSK